MIEKSVRWLLGVVVIVAGTVGLAACDRPGGDGRTAAAPASSRSRNLVLVSLDTLRADRLGCYGHPLGTSPFIDALSRRALTVVDVLAQNPSTILSHRAIFTGRYVYQLDPGPARAEATLAGILSGRGYSTAAFTDGGLMNEQYGNGPGFDVYDDSGGGFIPVMDRGMQWMDACTDGPFFLFLHTYDVHYPYTPPDPFADMFLPEGEPPYHLGADFGQDYWNRLALDRGGFEWISRRYDGGVRRTDADMMRLWSALAARGRLEDTVVVVMSDHGESLGERLYVGHRELYDVQLRVPLVLYPPVDRGFLLDGAVETIDILPTILDMLGQSPGPAGSGTSLIPPVAARSMLSRSRHRLSETGARAFRTDAEWKIILRENESLDELYRMSQDEEETMNLAGTFPEKAAELRQALSAFIGMSAPELRRNCDQRQIPVMLRAREEESGEDRLMEQLRKLGYIE
ncbi:sulfatase [bacterium]|nr:sulfatase [candidate division CSSED10-310 bacterium]